MFSTMAPARLTCAIALIPPRFVLFPSRIWKKKDTASTSIHSSRPVYAKGRRKRTPKLPGRNRRCAEARRPLYLLQNVFPPGPAFVVGFLVFRRLIARIFAQSHEAVA